MPQRLILRLALLSTILFTLSTNALAQQCHDYACVIRKVERLLTAKTKDYKALLDNLDSAESYPDSKADDIRKLRRRVFDAIEKERREAVVARDEAELAKNQVQAALDKIYFYDDKLGLAYDKQTGKYGFIDRSLTTKIQFKYDEVLPFDSTGFAKARRGSVSFLIDTSGLNEFKLSTEPYVADGIEALDLRNKNLEEISWGIFSNQTSSQKLKLFLMSSNKVVEISSSIRFAAGLHYLNLNNNQIMSIPSEIVKLQALKEFHLKYNQISYLPSEIGRLQSLKILDLSSNKITELPSEIEKLVNLKILYLKGNPIPKQEQEKIKKLLPNCRISFD